jgi:hypothetical protein
MAEADVGWVPVVEGYARARDAGARALALEPDLAEGHAGMGWIQMSYDWDWRAAEASLQRALELAPGNAEVLIAAGAMADNWVDSTKRSRSIARRWRRTRCAR